MTDRDRPEFERRIEQRLLAYAAIPVRPVDAGAVAQGAAVARRGGIFSGSWLPWRLGFLVALLALLIAAVTALVAGSKPAPPPFDGLVDRTTSMAKAVYFPRGVTLSDGTVLVVGTTGDRWLHAETYDPVAGRFSPVAAGNAGRSNGHDFGLTRLGGGDVLVVVAGFGSKDGTTSGGFALRYDPATRALRRTAGFGDTTGLPSEISAYDFATWPSTILPDGRVRWTTPGSPNSPLFDPATDAFSAGVATVMYPMSPSENQSSTVQLADGRYLRLGGSADPRVPAAIFDPRTGREQPLNWALVNAGVYSGTLLTDGRVLILGAGTAIYDPRTDSLTEIALPVTLSFQTWLPDGRALLEGEDQAGFGADPLPARPWLFDPTAGTFTRLARAATPGGTSAWVLLPDGRVLIVDGRPDAPEAAGSAWILH